MPPALGVNIDVKLLAPNPVGQTQYLHYQSEMKSIVVFSHMLFERFCSWLSKTVCDYMVHPLRKVSLWRNCCGFRYAAEPSACIQHYTLLLPKGEASIHQTRCSIPWKGVGAGRAPLHRAYLKGNWRSCLKKQPFHLDPRQNLTAGNLLNMEQGQQGVRT